MWIRRAVPLPPGHGHFTPGSAFGACALSFIHSVLCIHSTFRASVRARMASWTLTTLSLAWIGTPARTEQANRAAGRVGFSRRVRTVRMRWPIGLVVVGRAAGVGQMGAGAGPRLG